MGKSLKRKPVDGFQRRYSNYIQTSVDDNTRNIVKESKANDENYINELKNHITSFGNANQTYIGSILYSLLFDAHNNSSSYIKNRITELNSLYSYITMNRAWYDFWKVLAQIEASVSRKQTLISQQVLSESLDMYRLNLPYSQMVYGLDKQRQPILKKMTFFITKDLLKMIESPHSVGRKKKRELSTIQYQASEWYHYLNFAFGLYDIDNQDLLATNGMDYEIIENIQLPRELADLDELAKFIEENRKFTMNPYGIVIDCFNCADIDQIIMYEKESYLLWKIHFKTPGIILDHKNHLTEDHRGSEYCGYFDSNYFPRSLFSSHGSFVHFEFQLYSFLLECYADVVCGSTEVSKRFSRTTINMGEVQLDRECGTIESDSLGFRYIPRRIYNKVAAKSSSKVQLDSQLEKYFVSGHIRKLPDAHVASEESKRHALEYGIELSEGYTFVRPYSSNDEKVRTHYTKKI